MEINVGRLDATLRTLAALLALALSLTLDANTFASLALAVVAVLMTGTVLTRKCPAYTLLGISTCPEAFDQNHLPVLVKPHLPARIYK